LVERLRGREAGAAEEFVDRYGARIYRLARRLLNDPRDAEEVAQDVLLTVVEKIHTFKGEAAFSSWIYRIATNAAYGRLRSKRSRSEVSLESVLPVFDEEGRHVQPVVDWSHQVADPAVAEETRAALERGLSRLPEDYRSVIRSTTWRSSLMRRWRPSWGLPSPRSSPGSTEPALLSGRSSPTCSRPPADRLR
jgi:RNA polymerase sigma-70 factor (ECF subfamily)